MEQADVHIKYCIYCTKRIYDILYNAQQVAYIS